MSEDVASDIEQEDSSNMQELEEVFPHSYSHHDGNTPPKFENRNAIMCWLNSIVQVLLLTISDNEQTSYLKDIFNSFLVNLNSLQSTLTL